MIDETLAISIDKIIALRTVAGVGPDNEFLFGKGEKSHFDANVALREAAYECGAKDPKVFTSSRLRKHIASVAQSLNLKESEIQTISAYMDHTAQTHIEHYRVPSVELHTGKISKLLLALDAGTISKYRGKTIDEIDIDMSIDALDTEIHGEEQSEEERESTPTTKASTSKGGGSKGFLTPNKQKRSGQITPKKKPHLRRN